MYGTAERKIREIFEDAERNSPALIFIDEIDSLCGKRDDVHHPLPLLCISIMLLILASFNTSHRIYFYYIIYSLLGRRGGTQFQDGSNVAHPNGWDT
jgi:hypothetical protein